MKKILYVSIKSFEQFSDDVEKRLIELENGTLKKSHYEISFSSSDEMKRFFQNIDIIITIIAKRPNSIYELAAIINKDVSNVSRVVNFYEKIGALKIKNSIINGRAVKTPIVEYEKIQLSAA